MRSEKTDAIVHHPWVGTNQPQVPAEQQLLAVIVYSSTMTGNRPEFSGSSRSLEAVTSVVSQ